MNFESLNITPNILKALKDENYTTPTPIQEKSIPIILKGVDLLGVAQTGTGKTAAFAVPILQLLSARKPDGQRKKVRSLIITPTRELAIQIGESFKSYGKYAGLTTTVIFGGVGQSSQASALRKGVDILIATPGRLLDLISQKLLTLREVEIFVLDEADRMLDMGFINDVKKIISNLPRTRQSLFFSATMPPQITKFASTILHNPEKVSVTPISSTVDIIKQFVYFVDKENKAKLLLDVLKNQDIKTALVFSRTKHGANKITKTLLDNNIKAEAIHGNKSQSARQIALSNFKAKITRILVATDIAARGIDIEDMEYVINYDMPNIPESYVHRIGRTGRAGARGTSFSFCNSEEKQFLYEIEKLIAKKIPVNENHPFLLKNHSIINHLQKPIHQSQNPERKSNFHQPKRQTEDSRSDNQRKKFRYRRGA